MKKYTICWFLWRLNWRYNKFCCYNKCRYKEGSLYFSIWNLKWSLISKTPTCSLLRNSVKTLYMLHFISEVLYFEAGWELKEGGSVYVCMCAKVYSAYVQPFDIFEEIFPHNEPFFISSSHFFHHTLAVFLHHIHFSNVASRKGIVSFEKPVAKGIRFLFMRYQ